MIKLTGDWLKANAVIGHLAQIGEDAYKEGLARTGLYIEGKSKQHISKQDLNWRPLKEEYENWKQGKGFSTNILVKTSAYFQSITSWTSGKSVYAGVKKVARDKDGNSIANIAKIHEFGSTTRNIPARPLWQPTLKETIGWLKKNDYGHIVIKKLKI